MSPRRPSKILSPFFPDRRRLSQEALHQSRPILHSSPESRSEEMAPRISMSSFAASEISSDSSSFVDKETDHRQRSVFSNFSRNSSLQHKDVEAARDSEVPSASRFKSTYSEIGFCAAMALSQALGEYLQSGFAIYLNSVLKQKAASDGLDAFWPACLLTLLLSAFILVFGRFSDKYGGFLVFQSGILWLALWTLIAGFATSDALLDLCRAMQGLACAAFFPATIAMFGSFYPDGRRKNIVTGIYAGFASVGFFAGFLVAAGLPPDHSEWYFWIPTTLSVLVACITYWTTPPDTVDRRGLQLQTNWIGSLLIVTGLILVCLALNVVPYLKSQDGLRIEFTDPKFLCSLTIGTFCLLAAVWWEGWMARSPLLPFEFFKSWRTRIMSLACLCFYAAYFTWLYMSAALFDSPGATASSDGVQGVRLALWYTPTAVGGIICCMVGGAILHKISPRLLLPISGLAWVAAPLLFALCKSPLNYWAIVMPSMLCATIGIDLTYTISLVVLQREQPLKYQGLAGAACSIFVNLAGSFALPIAEIVRSNFAATAPAPQENTVAAAMPTASADASLAGIRAAFWYATISACVGLLLCVLFVCLPSRGSRADEDQRSASWSSSTSSDVCPLTVETKSEAQSQT